MSKNTLSKYVKKEYINFIEEGIEKFTNDYIEINQVPSLYDCIYDSKLEEIIEALKNNKDLIKTENDAKNIAFFSQEELYPDKYEKIIKLKELEEYKKNDIKSSSAFKCSKCKKSKCSVVQKQTRAGDEPATTFVTCLECGYNFSFN